MFQQLRDSILNELRTIIPSRRNENSPPCESNDRRNEPNEFEASLDRLLDLANEKDTIIFSQAETRRIISDIEKIFHFLENARPLDPKGDTKRDFEAMNVSNFTENDFDDLTRLKGILNSTLSIEKNEGGKRTAFRDKE
jgi:hypothetical protein